MPYGASGSVRMKGAPNSFSWDAASSREYSHSMSRREVRLKY
jgi:hypothetical protein